MQMLRDWLENKMENVIETWANKKKDSCKPKQTFQKWFKLRLKKIVLVKVVRKTWKRLDN